MTIDPAPAPDQSLALTRLLQLVSPSLPVGGFTWSQGLEYAVECGWVRDADSLAEWVGELLRTSLSQLDLPILIRLCRAVQDNDEDALEGWTDHLLASRETRELRNEEQQRGRALASLLPSLGMQLSPASALQARRCQLTGFAIAACHWSIPLRDAATGYLYGWLEQQILAGVKIIPLGQTAGQVLLAQLAGSLPDCLAIGFALDDDEIGSASFAQAFASSRHETQYTRIYRS